MATPDQNRDPNRDQALPAWPTKDLLTLRGAGAADIRALLRLAHRFEAAPGSASGALSGWTVCNIFFEDSTRTRLSFSAAAHRLGAATADLAGSGSSRSKGETLLDTARNIHAMSTACGGSCVLVVRCAAPGGPAVVAHAVAAPVLNAGDGRHEHPTQGLLDAYAFAEAHGRAHDGPDAFDLTGLTLAVVGDIANSRVARSDAAVFRALGAEVVLVGPSQTAPPALGAALGCKVEHDLDAALPGVDGVQMLRVQAERASLPIAPSQYTRGHRLNARRAAGMQPHAVVMHPGPMNRGVEIDSCVADSGRSLVLRQAACGVAVRMAAMVMTAQAAAR